MKIPNPKHLPVTEIPVLTDLEAQHRCNTRHKLAMLEIIDILHLCKSDVYDALCITAALSHWLLDHFVDEQDAVDYGIVLVNTILDHIKLDSLRDENG